MYNAGITTVFNTLNADATELARQPALRFERETGLQGIARVYRLPNGMSGAEFEKTYFWSETRPAILDQVNIPESRIQQLNMDVDSFIARSSPAFTALLVRAWDNVVRLNSALRYVEVDKSNPNQLYDALLGVASAFNTDDINFYLQKHWREKTAAYPTVAADLSMIQTRVGVRPEWVASPQTIKRINDQLDRKGVPPAFRQTIARQSTAVISKP